MRSFPLRLPPHVRSEFHALNLKRHLKVYWFSRLAIAWYCRGEKGKLSSEGRKKRRWKGHNAMSCQHYGIYGRWCDSRVVETRKIVQCHLNLLMRVALMCVWVFYVNYPNREPIFVGFNLITVRCFAFGVNKATQRQQKQRQKFYQRCFYCFIILWRISVFRSKRASF